MIRPEFTRQYLLVIALAVLVMTSVPLLQSQTAQRPAASIGANAQVAKFDPQTNTALVNIANTSSKDISAFTVKVTAIYTDGKQHADERLVDFLWSMIAQQKYGDSTSGVFHPGQTLEIVASFNADGKNPIANVTANVVAVVYADQTAQVRDEEALGRILENRRGSVLTKQKALAAFKQALADPANPHPLADAVSALKEGQAAEKNTPSGALKLEFATILKDMDGLSQRAFHSHTTGSQLLRDYMKEMEAEITAVSLHCQLRRVQ